MAERRMFSKRVIYSAKFLKMPVSTQCLYFHLGLNADDDGVVEAYTVMNSIGATEDDLKILVAKDFVYVLNEDLVTYILDWKENNKIRADRKVDSIYKDLLLQILPNVELQQKKQRADVAKKLLNQGQVTNEQPMNNQWTTNGRPMDSIGKDSIGKDNIKEIYKEKFETFYKAYPRKVGKANVEKWFAKNKPNDELFELIMRKLEMFKKSPDWFKDNGQFIPYPTTWLNQKRWEDEISVNGMNVFEEDYSVFKESTMSEEEYIRKSENGGKKYV